VSASLERAEPGPRRPDDRTPAPRRPGGEHAVIELQRCAGNQAVARLLTERRTLARFVQSRPPSHPVLREGAGFAGPALQPEVTHLQQRLNEDGAQPPLAIDGLFGPLTRAAVVAFQGRHGLAADGVVGLRTWGVIDELERRGLAGPQRTVLDDVRPVDQTTHDAIEGILHQQLPLGQDMTGTGPGGSYETEMLDALDKLAEDRLSRLVDTPATDMAHAARSSEAGQREVEAFFGSAITLASRKPTGEWHPGSSFMGLADASNRELATINVNGWIQYFMTTKGLGPAEVGVTHHYDERRADPDRAERDRVRDLWKTTRGGQDKTIRMARAWPAEASTGTVYLQLRERRYQDRVGMWKLFLTMVHEFLHLVTHPNYMDVAELIAGTARNILVEGMDDHFAQQVWPGVLARAAGDATLRQEIEGPFFEPIANADHYASGSQIAQELATMKYTATPDADAIAARAGEANARAAFFMGHVEALGLGEGTAAEHPLDGLATWRPGEGGAPDVYVVPPAGETVARIRERTGSTHIEDEQGFVWVDTSHAFTGGTRLTIPGIRWHTAIKEDTRGQVATQHGITQAQLETANDLRPARPTKPIAAGTLLLIPAGP
jgi:hypothetical protein